MYTKSPEWYDDLHENKDYVAEASGVTDMIRRHLPGARTLLDVACGTGRHLQHFCDSFACEGLDMDGGLLEIAQRRLPEVPFTQGDMTDFHLGRRFDAVTCLFSSIGYAESAERMRAAVRTMAGHLNPRGILIIEPWILPEAWDAWIAGTDNVCVVRKDDRTVVRVRTVRRTGNLTELIMHYVAACDGEITSADERHQVRMFSLEDYLGAAAEAGLETSWDPKGITGRGLLAMVPSASPGRALSHRHSGMSLR
jgi:SAM-dependent methyltransferase